MNYLTKQLHRYAPTLAGRIAILTALCLALVGGALAFGASLEQVTLIGSLLAAPMLMGASDVAEITEVSTPDDHKVRDVSLTLSRLRPDRFTLDTIMRRMEASDNGMETEAATAQKVEWEEDDVIPYEDTINGAVTAGSSGASVDITVNNGSYYREEMLLYLPNNSSDAGAVLFVSAVSGNDLTVYRLDQATSETSFGTVPAVADAEEIIILTNSKEEYSNASGPQGTMPATLYNYTQILDGVVSASATRMATENYTEDDYTRNQNNLLYELRRRIENAMCFGERTKIVDPTSGKTRTTMGGVTRYLTTNDLTYTAGSLTEGNLIDFARQIFSGNNGSSLRFFFTAPKLTAEIDKILISSGTLQSTRDEEVLGVEATRIHSTFGDLMLLNNQAFEELGKENWGLVLDPMNIRRRTLRNMTINDVEENDADGRAKQWIEEFSVEVRKEVTHGVVRDDSTDSFV